MASGKEIKARIRSVKNTGKITKAMELISTVKMKKAQQSVFAARPFAIEAARIFGLIGTINPATEVSIAKKEIIIVVASDKGLCGAYNINVFKEIAALVQENPDTSYEFIAIGKRAKEFILRTNNALLAEYSDLFKDTPKIPDSRKVFRHIQSLYASGDYRAVRVVYGHYISAISQKPVRKLLLPIKKEDIVEFLSEIGAGIPEQSTPTEHEMEPSKEVILEQVLPMIQALSFHESLLEAKASEHSSRMVAMKNAKDSAAKKASLLTLSYNKARQSAITKEVSEIVSGIESMKD